MNVVVTGTRMSKTDAKTPTISNPPAGGSPLTGPPAEDVWWVITSPATGQPAYTMARLWFEARAAFGGDCNPTRVPPEGVARVEEMLKAAGAKSWKKRDRNNE